MNILQDIRELKTGDRELRKFGMLVGGVLTLLGLVWFERDKPFFAYALVPGFALLTLSLSIPHALRWVYVAWMSLAFVLGFVMAHVILTLCFFLLVTPMGLLARICGKDFLRLKLERDAKSYWIQREPKSPSAAEYERQF